MTPVDWFRLGDLIAGGVIVYFLLYFFLKGNNRG
jgi:hypothetical protein